MRQIALFTEEHMPDGAMQLAIGANRVCREARLQRRHFDDGRPVVYELTLRFTIPEDRVLDMKSIKLTEAD